MAVEERLNREPSRARMTKPDEHRRIAEIRERLDAIATERRALNEELVALERHVPNVSARLSTPERATTPLVTKRSPSADKIALFRRLFAGRGDVFPVHWENAKSGKSGYAPACNNEWKPGICNKPRVKCGECPHQAFIPISDEIIRRHLGGPSNKSTSTDFVAGVYPLLPDNTCHFLAVDFDGEHWASDTIAFVETCQKLNISVGLERSRSGAGGHAWLFFEEPLPARLEAPPIS